MSSKKSLHEGSLVPKDGFNDPSVHVTWGAGILMLALLLLPLLKSFGTPLRLKELLGFLFSPFRWILVIMLRIVPWEWLLPYQSSIRQ